MTTRMLPTLLATLVALFGLVAPRAVQAGDYRGPRHGPPPGRVVVTNQSGGDVTVTLSGQPARFLPAWQTAELYAAPGETTLRASYTQFGAERFLQSDHLVVTPNRTVGVTLSPEETARLLVTNQSALYAQLVVDGRPGAAFKPGESRVVAMAVGRRDLAMTADGRTLARSRMDLRAFAEPRWVAEVPRVGSLVVSNPLPIAVELVCDKGLVRSVAAYGQTTYAGLSVGTFHLTARRTTGEFIDTETAAIRPGATTGWRVDPPRTGFVSLDSDHWLGTEVRVDGRRVAVLRADASSRIEVAVGWHEIEVRDDQGRGVHQAWVEVKPYDTARVSFGGRSHQQAYDGREDRGERDDHHDHAHEGRGGQDQRGAVVAESCEMH